MAQSFFNNLKRPTKYERENTALIISTLIVIVLMALITVSGITGMNAVQKRADDIINTNLVKLDLIEHMRMAARERTTILQRMVHEGDPFKRDDDYMLFNRQGLAFRLARDELTGMVLLEKESVLLLKQDELVRLVAEEQDNVLTLIDNEKGDDAEQWLIERVVPIQNSMLQILNEISDLQIHSAESAANAARNEKNKTKGVNIITFVIASLITITVAIVMMRILKQIRLRQQHYLDELERANSAKSTFVANMSHEIRTPLTSIIGFADASLHQEQQSEKDRIQAFGTIVRSGRHLLQIINDILDLSKIEADRLEFESVDTDIFALLADVDNIIRMQAQAKKINFDIKYALPIPRFVKTDAMRLKQVLINLAGNAIKFTDKGFVEIEVSYDNGRHELLIAVKDTGLGISENQLKKLFAPFTQADSSTTKRYGGTGLGLYLSKKIIMQLGGELSVSSRENEGSCFTVRLSALGARDFIGRQEDIGKTTKTSTLLKQYLPLRGSVLIAEDSRDNQILFKSLVSKFGANVRVVENGQEAIDEIANSDFDMVLMDMQMPVMDGTTAVRHLREIGSKIPIIALTANAMKEDREQCLGAGCDDFLAKPVSVDGLYQMLSKFLPVIST